MHRRNDLLGMISGHDCRGKNELSTALLALDDGELRAILSNMLAYYEINDAETSNIHSRIFRTLYLDKPCPSYDEVAEMYHIHVYTLDRYRQRYNRLAEKFVADALNKTALKKTVNY